MSTPFEQCARPAIAGQQWSVGAPNRLAGNVISVGAAVGIVDTSGAFAQLRGRFRTSWLGAARAFGLPASFTTSSSPRD